MSYFGRPIILGLPKLQKSPYSEQLLFSYKYFHVSPYGNIDSKNNLVMGIKIRIPLYVCTSISFHNFYTFQVEQKRNQSHIIHQLNSLFKLLYPLHFNFFLFFNAFITQESTRISISCSFFFIFMNPEFILKASFNNP